MSVATTLVIFVIGAGLLWLWFRRKQQTRTSELNAVAEALGLRVATDEHATRAWVDQCPDFRFMRVGTNRRAEGRLSGERAGTAFDVVHYRAGSQTSSHVGHTYMVFAAEFASASASFSLGPAQPFDQQRSGASSELVPMPGWTSLEDFSLFIQHDGIHGDRSVPVELLQRVSQLADSGHKVRLEYLGGRFVHYVAHKDPIEAKDVQRLIDDGFALMSCLR